MANNDEIKFTQIHKALLPAIGVNPAGLRAMLWEVAQLARQRWVALAKDNLNSTASLYANAIQKASWLNKNTVVITLVGKLPVALEQGRAPWDLRTTLLKGRPYLRVPFRQFTPRSSAWNSMGSQYGRAMGFDSGSDDFKQLLRTYGNPVHKAAKQLDASLSEYANGRFNAVFASNTPTSRGRLEAGLAPLVDNNKHLFDPFADMVRFESQTKGGKTQSQYMTWRTISSNPASFREGSGGRNWTHPGFRPLNLVEQVRQYIQNEAWPDVLDKGAKP